MESDCANTICENERKKKTSTEKPFESEFLTSTSARGLRHIDNNYLWLEEEKPVYDLLAYVTSDSLARFLFCASFAVLSSAARVQGQWEQCHPPPPSQKKPKVEKGQRFLTGFKGFEKDSAGNESASVGISEDSDHPQSEFVPSPPPQALSEGDAPATAEKQKVEQELTRTIVDAWFKLFPWLTYDKEEKEMRCTVCMEDKVAKNSFTRRCSNFRKSALTEHVATLDHRNALETPVHRSNQEEVVKTVLTKEETGHESSPLDCVWRSAIVEVWFIHEFDGRVWGDGCRQTESEWERLVHIQIHRKWYSWGVLGCENTQKTRVKFLYSLIYCVFLDWNNKQWFIWSYCFLDSIFSFVVNVPLSFWTRTECPITFSASGHFVPLGLQPPYITATYWISTKSILNCKKMDSDHWNFLFLMELWAWMKTKVIQIDKDVELSVLDHQIKFQRNQSVNVWIHANVN